MTAFKLDRRTFLAGTAALAINVPMRVYAQAAPQKPKEFLLAGGLVLDLSGDNVVAAQRDILVRNGEIVEIGEKLVAPSAGRIDVSDMIVSPGLIDTHWHMWNTIARGFSMSNLGPFAKTMGALAKAWTPEAGALSVRLAIAEAVACGITTVHNWAHNTKGVTYAEAEFAAMRDSGIRGRFSYGYPNLLPPDQRMDFDALRSFVSRHDQDESSGLLTLGLCTRGPDRSLPIVWQEEWRVARDLKLPITTHIASDRKSAALGSIAKMKEGGFLGPDVQLVHATHASADDFRIIRESGSPLSISPWTEFEVGYGVTPMASIVEAGLRPGLSVDNMILAGTADMFQVMKLTADLAAAEFEKQGRLTDDTVLRWATVDGAKGMGVSAQTGSLAKGMRADIIAIRTDDLNTIGSVTPAFLMTHATRPENVDLVMIDGVVHKQNGKLTRIDEAELKESARKTMMDLKQRAGI